MSAPLLQMQAVEFEAAGRRLLGPVDLAVQPGRRVVVLGPNGAGKSLLLRLAHGLLQPTRGQVECRNANASPRHAQAMVFQHAVPMRRRAVADIEFALAARGAPRQGRRERALQALETFGLVSLAERQARVLSGGERQRLALARAWALSPTLLFLDEPTAALDPRATREVEEAIERFHAAGTAIVMSTHDLGQARRLADEVVFVYQGRICEHAPAEAFFAAPASEEAGAFIRGELLW